MAKREILTCQQVLSITVFLGFMIHHMLRVNISIAIVEMVARNSTGNTNTTLGPRFTWNEAEKNEIFGYFFWGYVLTQIPGGRLSEKFGFKIVVGTGILAASILTLVVPFVSTFGHRWLAFSRFCLGVAMGIHWPSTPPIVTKWIPPAHRSTFLSHMTASSLGVAFTLPACGYMLAYWGWPSVFYVTGGIALTWVLFWFYLVYDTPEEHPRISIVEKEKLAEKIRRNHFLVKDPPVPWIKMLTSGPVWAIISGNACAGCTFFIAFNQLPTYMSHVLLFNIKQNGWLSSLPYLVRYVVSLLSSIAADKLISSKKLSTTAVRKLLTVTFFFGSGCLFTVQAIWGYSAIVSVVVFTTSLGLMGLVTAGVYANSVDIAPAYSGTVIGISQVPGALSGYVTTEVVAFFTKEKQDFPQWANVFWFLVCVNAFAGIFALIFTSGEEQSWNLKMDDKEMKRLDEEDADVKK